MGPTTNDLDRLDEMDDTDTDVVDGAIIISVTAEEEDLDTARAQFEQTRAEMGETIDAIKERLNPQKLMGQAKESVREATIGRAQDAANAAVETAKDTGTTVAGFIKENPIPAALTGLGITWLLMSARKQNS